MPNYCDPDGRYFENIDFLGEAITVQGVDPTDRDIVAGNISAAHGGGLYCASDSSPTFTSRILWNNWPQESSVQSGLPRVTYTDIAGGWEGRATAPCPGIPLDRRLRPAGRFALH